jgi:hypothetical protein
MNFQVKHNKGLCVLRTEPCIVNRLHLMLLASRLITRVNTSKGVKDDCVTIWVKEVFSESPGRGCATSRPQRKLYVNYV